MRKNVIHKLAISACACALVFGTLAFAQDTTQAAPSQNPPAGPQHMRTRRAGRLQQMAQYLNLTDEQKAKIKPILQDEAQQMKALHSDTSLTPEQRKAKAQEIRQASRSQIEPILTSDQVAKLNSRGKGAGRGARKGETPLAMMSKSLNLTADQKAKLEPIFADHRKQLLAVRQDSSLTDQQKRAKLKEIQKATHQQVMSVLTPEQQQQFKEMRGKRMHRNGPPAEAAPQSAPAAPPSGM